MTEPAIVQSPTHATLGHVQGLDGIRGLAVLLVVLSHVKLELLPPTETAFRVRDVVRGGWLGVDMFFVLSGFLITSLLLGEQDRFGAVRRGHFYARRALRLLPALYVLLLAQYIFARIVHLPTEPEKQTITAALVYVNNWQSAWHPATQAAGLGHLWSLAVEEQFYIIWPTVLLALLALRRRNSIVPVVIGVLVLLIAVRRMQVFAGSDAFATIGRTDTHADGLLVGALAAWLWSRRLVPRRHLYLAGWVAAAVLIRMEFASAPSNSFWYNGGSTAFALLVAVMILAVVDGRWAGARVFETKPLRLLGRVSYGLYLWHFLVISVVIRQAASLPWQARTVLAVTLTASCTAASWYLVERPARRLRRRWEVGTARPDRTGPPSRPGLL